MRVEIVVDQAAAFSEGISKKNLTGGFGDRSGTFDWTTWRMAVGFICVAKSCVDAWAQL